MAKKKHTSRASLIQELIPQNTDTMKELFKSTLEEFLEAEMTDHLGADRSQVFSRHDQQPQQAAG